MRSAIVLATLGLASIPLLPRTAEACSPADPCAFTEKWERFDLVSTTIATDGVLLFDAQRGVFAGQITDAEALAHVEAQVLADGQPIAGEFELAEGWRGVVWRPESPLPAGASLSINLQIDNEQLAEHDVDPCDTPLLHLGPYAAQVSNGLTPALSNVSLTAETAHTINPTHEFDTLVCCDGAYPILGDECGPIVTWSVGSCRATEGHGRLAVFYALDLAQLPAELASVVSWRIVTADDEHPADAGLTEWSVHDDQVICAHVEILNHVSGDVLTLEQQCWGEEHADQLGSISIDPGPELAEVCTGQAYVCEVADEAWDPNACEPYAAGEGEGGEGDGDGDGETGGAAADQQAKGCSIDSRSPSPWLAAGLLLLGLLRRRQD